MRRRTGERLRNAYDADLARMLASDVAGLAEIRSAVRWAEPAAFAFGERWPRAASELVDVDPDGVAALPHRRGSLLVFETTDDVDVAAANAEALYDGTFVRTVLPIPGEVVVEVAVASVSDDLVTGGRAWIDVADLGAVHHVADADGVIRLATLAGDRVRVIAAFDADGHGGMVDGEERGT